ncbi:MAG: hypothetical protein CVU67_00055 [Deltaproteobacteria bacterium HGW-Deltaproteobacteria-24]|jgi:hypothetical protein|nr:MAG: hypothetical protein CVU67_00055 [Deltaproteobacteria bacterium HGW-Deltaproteobacteria-24]
MILNTSKIKTEALLLFCKDIILSYQDANDDLFDINVELKEFIQNNTQEILRELQKATKPYDFYLTKRDNTYVKAVLRSYEYLNQMLNQQLENGKAFNPSMLCFSLLASWFAELQKESRSKEYIYFILYPYALVYDKLLLNVGNQEFKALNIAMITVAEKVVLGLDNYKFN